MGCSEDNPTTASQTVTQEKAAPLRAEPTEVEMVAAMEAHYSVVILAHDAVLQGNLEAFRAQLTLASEQGLPPTAPPAWQPLHEQLRAAARDGMNAGDLEAAATALAQVVVACGTCHTALGSGPIYPAPAPDDGDDPVETAMLDHKWVTERLWEGVTGPWDNAWKRGAAALAATQVFGEADPNLTITDDLGRREDEFRAIGAEAGTAATLNERAALYGRLLATCGGCHTQVGVTFATPD